MEQLLPVINKLQDVFNSVGGEQIDLPQICVIGSQSSGKSSVLEHIVGKDFLPRGSGIVTRRPLILQLHHIPAPKSGPQEWGEFLHKPKKTYTDFEEIRKEIEAETERHCGPKGISDTPIRLSVYSHDVLNLTLVDLPGLTKVTIPGQSKELPEEIRNMALKFVTNPNAIILCVSAANADIATSDGIQLAKEIDPEGHRTLGVVTKIDIMDRGTDALEMLTGQVIPLELGFVGVVMRSQQDIKDGKPISEALKDEEKFFATHDKYRSISSRCGTRYLTKVLNQLLMRHIRNSLPELKARISKMMQDCQNEMASYGDSMFQENKSGLLLNIINSFSKDYGNSIEGKSEELSVNELYGGARINYIFTEVYSKYIESVRTDSSINEQDIRTAIKNSTGPRSALFVPEGSFEFLVKNLVKRLEAPSQECVEQVFAELQRIVAQLTESKELQRFKNLRVTLIDVVNTLLLDCKAPTRMMISNLINIELAYMNTNHEDFIGGGAAVSKLFESMAADHRAEEQQQQQQQLGDRPQSSSGGPPPRPSAPPQRTAREPAQPQSNQPEGGFFGRYFGGNPGQQPQQPSPQTHRPAPAPPSNPQAQPQHQSQQPMRQQNVPQWKDSPAKPKPTDKNPFQAIPGGPIALHMPTTIRAGGAMNNKEEFETQLIKNLISSYFDIVCKNLSDTVPKTIMHFLVNTSKTNLQNNLVQNLYKEELFEELLEENPEIAQRRKRCKEMLEALVRANAVLMELRDFDFR